MSIEAIMAFVIGVGGIITAIWTSRSSATKTELDSLRLSLKDLRDIIEDHKLTIKDIQAENNRLKMENNVLRTRIEDLENKTQQQDSASACLVDRIHILELDNLKLRAMVDTLEADKVRLQDENQALRLRVQALERGE